MPGSSTSSDESLPPWARAHAADWVSANESFMSMHRVNEPLFDANPEQAPEGRFPRPPISTTEYLDWAASTQQPIPESDRQFKVCLEATPRDGVPRGTVTHHTDWAESTVYPGTKRTFAVYVPPPPAAGAADKPLALICIPDGG